MCFHGEYREIVPGEKIVYTEVFEMPDAGPEADAAAPVNTVTFELSGDGGTILKLLVRTGSKELRDVIMNSGMETGLHGQLELIEEIALSLG